MAENSAIAALLVAGLLVFAGPRSADAQASGKSTPSAAVNPAASPAAIPVPTCALPPGSKSELDEAARLAKETERLYAERDSVGAVHAAECALFFREKNLGRDHPLVGSSSTDLGGIAMVLGDYARAEPLLRRGVSILEKAPPGSEADFSAALNNLANLLDRKGDRAAALAMQERAVAILEKARGPNDPDLAVQIRGLGRMMHSRRQFEKAEKLLKRALAIHVKVADEREMLRDFMALGELFQAVGRYTLVAENYTQADALASKLLGPDHIERAALLSAMANAFRGDKQYDKAKALYEEAIRITEATYSPSHPEVARLVFELARVAEAKRDIDLAVALRERGNKIQERYLDLFLSSGSDQEKRRFAARFLQETEETVSMHVWRAPNSKAAARLALTTILRRKGRVLDAMSESVAALRRRLGDDDRKVLDELARVRAELSSLVIRGPGQGARGDYLARVAELAARERDLESAIATRSSALRVAPPAVTLEDVQRAIPEGAALVELFQYRVRDPKAYSALAGLGPRYYVAYILRRTGDIAWINLRGSADDIDTVIKQVRVALASPTNMRFGDPASRLDRMVMEPIASLLGSTRKVLLSPDGPLNLVPFAALVDDKGHFRVEAFSFTYLTSGRDLLRAAASSASSASSAPKRPAVIMANPNYDAGMSAPQPGAGGAGGKRGGGLGKAQFPELPGTQAEARELAAVVTGATNLTGDAATEAALKAVHGPRILHIATHGFFLGEPPSRKGGRGLELTDEPLPNPTVTPPSPGAPPSPPQPSPGPEPSAEVLSSANQELQNPLLLSGLALSGANLRRSGEEDGVLTALEAAGLDLDGTKLVVLSACETGVGEAIYGEGVYGLRRALVMAGSETQVMSLWKVDDDATRDLMTAYYKKLLREGAPRGEGMRDVQLALMKSPSTAHPYFWASFIVSGASDPIEAPPPPREPPAAAAPPKVAPGARGCGCSVVDSSQSGAAPEALALLLLAAGVGLRGASSARRRRRS